MHVLMQNWKTKTLGGIQFWTDYRWISGCRLQKNELMKNWRVLDAKNVRQASGSRDKCMIAFSELVESVAKDVWYDRVVLLMHGLMRTPRSMNSLVNYLTLQGISVPIAPSYASSQASIGVHAAAFRELVESLPGQPRIDIVGHSMGNIIVRHAIADWQTLGDPKQTLTRMKHMVMLGPPNRGATIARRLAKTGLFGVITGKGGMELGPNWDELQDKLATPPFPFAIVAGNLKSKGVTNPLVDGQGDFVVSVEETHLDGAAIEIEVPALHSFLMDTPSVHEFIAKFLRS